MVLAAILAFATNVMVLRNQEKTRPVVIAAGSLDAGRALSPADFKLAEVDLDDDVFATLIPWEQVASLNGMIAARNIEAGRFVLSSDVRSAAAPGELRAISIPIDPEHAVGGDLRAGDRIDLIAVVDGSSSYVLSGVEVLAVPAESRGSLTATNSFFLVVAVDADQALAVATAIRQGQVEVVRSTGAEAVAP
jgi:Flp pilus assembly protein CpaB